MVKKTESAGHKKQVSSDCGNSSKSRNKIVRQKTDEDIKKLYGLRKVEHETKHLEIMIEMQRQTANIMSKKRC